MDRVTTSLFLIEDFRIAFEIGRMVYKLFPLYNNHMINHNYLLVESVLTTEAIVTNISFKSQDTFKYFRLETFNFTVKKVIMILHAESSIKLVK